MDRSELTMVDVLEFVVAKLPWMGIGYLAGVGTRGELVRLTLWLMGRRGDERRGRPIPG